MNLLSQAWILLTRAPLEMVISFSCFIITVSCILLINHMPAGLKHLPEKLMMAWLAFGAFGGMVGPFFAYYIDPTWAEIMFYTGAAAFSLWATWPYWHELPVLDRRKSPRGAPVMEETDYDRRAA